MIAIRSLLYVALFYLWTAVVAILATPLLLGPTNWVFKMVHRWGRGVLLLLGICGIQVEVRGRQYIPTGAALVAFVYLGLMLGFLPAIRRDHSAWVLLWVLLVTKSCDIGAYFAGKAFGRHKLIPWLSPGKTWEGLVGGVLMSAAVSVAGLEVLRGWGVIAGVPLWAAVIPGVLFAVVGQTGDLLESMLKRDAGIKDSGKVLPGFGGVLDVIDSPLLVAPLAFWVLRLFGGAGWL